MKAEKAVERAVETEREREQRCSLFDGGTARIALIIAV